MVRNATCTVRVAFGLFIFILFEPTGWAKRKSQKKERSGENMSHIHPKCRSALSCELMQYRAYCCAGGSDSWHQLSDVARGRWLSDITWSIKKAKEWNARNSDDESRNCWITVNQNSLILSVLNKLVICKNRIVKSRHYFYLLLFLQLRIF